MRVIASLLILILSAQVLSQKSVRTVTPGIRLELASAASPHLCSVIEVGADGFSAIPKIGPVFVAGLTQVDVELKLRRASIESGFAAGDLKVRLLGSASEDILFSGAVKISGGVKFRAGMRLSDILLMAQPSNGAEQSEIEILSREGVVEIINFRGMGTAASGGDPLLRAGDVIFVPIANRTPEVFVIGEVAQAGRVDYFQGLTVKKAIAVAGGPNGNADLTKVQIERDQKIVDTVNVSLGYDAPLERGDIVRVPRTAEIRFVVVTGEVLSPGQLDFRPGMRLTEAIRMSGGLKLGLKGKKISLARRVNGNLKRTTYDLEKIYARQQEDPVLEPNDAIEVNPDGRMQSGSALYN